MQVLFRNSFGRDLRRIRNRSIGERVKEATEQVKEASDLTEISDVRKLRGGRNHYRIRIGDYRIGFQFNEGTVIFVRCLPRRDFYQYFP